MNSSCEGLVCDVLLSAFNDLFLIEFVAKKELFADVLVVITAHRGGKEEGLSSITKGVSCIVLLWQVSHDEL
jgi:hypothetical protein